MRNPNLVYRNSNQMINQDNASDEDRPQTNTSKTMKEESVEDEQVLNLKCIPYLIRNYGFHTVP